MKWSFPLIVLLCLAAANAARAEEPAQLAPLIQSIGPCKHLSVRRYVLPASYVENIYGKGFEYETSDRKTIARVLAYFASLPAKDSWHRDHGIYPLPDTPAVMRMFFTKTDGRKVEFFYWEPNTFGFNLDHEFKLRNGDLTEFYRIIGKLDVVRIPPFVGPSQITDVYNGSDDYHTRQRQVRDVQPVNRDPLFDNVPFFRLRPGDRLVKAREVAGGGPGQTAPGKEPAGPQYYLESDGRYFALRAEEKEGKLLLPETPDSVNACALFDWKQTPENARVLRAMLPPQWSKSFSLEKYEEIVRAAESQFPEVMAKQTVGYPELSGDQFSEAPGIADLSHVSFDGLIFDRQKNEVAQYEITIGKSLSVVTAPLLQGPRPPERGEPEAGARPASEKPKGSNPALAGKKKADSEAAIAFRKMVDEIIQPDGNRSAGAP